MQLYSRLVVPGVKADWKETAAIGDHSALVSVIVWMPRALHTDSVGAQGVVPKGLEVLAECRLI